MRKFVKDLISLLDRSYFASYLLTLIVTFCVFWTTHDASFFDTLAASALISLIYAIPVTLIATLLDGLFI